MPPLFEEGINRESGESSESLGIEDMEITKHLGSFDADLMVPWFEKGRNRESGESNESLRMKVTLLPGPVGSWVEGVTQLSKHRRISSRDSQDSQDSQDSRFLPLFPVSVYENRESGESSESLRMNGTLLPEPFSSRGKGVARPTRPHRPSSKDSQDSLDSRFLYLRSSPTSKPWT